MVIFIKQGLIVDQMYFITLYCYCYNTDGNLRHDRGDGIMITSSHRNLFNVI